MNLPELCIRRPVMTTLLMAAFLIFGFIGYRALPVSELPTVDFPTIAVTANLPGASPETMAAAVATPLEGQFSTIAGLDSMTSTSAQGSTSITLQFSLERNIDAAAQDVQSAISAALRKLPPNMPAPPSFRKVNPADSPIFYIAMLSPTLPLSLVNEYAETQLAQRLSTIPGVAQVQIFGSQKFAVRVQANPDQLASRGIGIDELQQALAQNNVNQPIGQLDGSRQTFAIKDGGQLSSAAAYRPLIVTWRNGAPVRLEEVATPIDSVENNKIASWNVDQRAIVLAIQRQPGANTIETVDAIKRVLPSFQSKLPAAIEMRVLFDRSVSIREAIDDVQFTLILAGFLVILVILLFLRNLSATLIPALALPISVVGTFGAMSVLGYSLDNLSLLALTLCVGFVVDDAIVMLENIVRHVEQGETPFDGGDQGRPGDRLHDHFDDPLADCRFHSGALHERHRRPPAARIRGHHLRRDSGLRLRVADPDPDALQPLPQARRTRFARPSVPDLRALLRRPARPLRAPRSSWRWRTPAACWRGFFATLLLTGLCSPRCPRTSCRAATRVRSSPSPKAPRTCPSPRWSNINARSPKSSPGTRHPLVHVGRGAGGIRPTANTGTIFMILKPRVGTPLVSGRNHSAPAPETGGRAGHQGVHAESAGHPHRRPADRRAVSVHPAGHRPRRAVPMDRHPDRSRIRQLPGFVDVTNNLNNLSPVLALDIDRDKLATLGLSYGQVEDALQSAFSARQVSTIYGATNQYQVILEVAPEYQADPEALSRLYVRSSNGKLIPLDTVARFSRKTQALTVNHQGQLPSVTIVVQPAAGGIAR
jgi:HAE1 family hydrophobic/amphiphilic exporter-1